MKENQNIEFKQSWRDEYLKWICGFANADGGKIYIGLDDNGDVVGIDNSKKLLEDLPNKIQDILGIVVDIDLKTKDDLEYIEIDVEASPYPINYKGQYHYRSGSTKQELKGQALNSFLLKRYGKHWDGVEVPNIGVKDLDNYSFERFIQKALKSKRVDENDVPKDYDELLDKLRLTENGYIKRAGVLLFAKEPQKYVSGAYIKIAYFENSADILYQDVIEGNLLYQVEKTFDLLFTKYLKALISYEGVQRVEQFDYDENALREVIHNAIVHKDYSSGIPIQIGVFKDKLFVYNAGELPQNWTIETMTSAHRSIPYNPEIANVFFKAGLIESWGRGIEKVISASKAYNATAPKFTWDNGLNVEFTSKYPNKKDDWFGDKLGDKLGETRVEIIKLMHNNPKISITQLAKELSLSTTAIEKNIKFLKDNGHLVRVGSAKSGYWEVVSNDKD